MRAYKYKLRPSAKVIAIFEAWLSICCELYNAAFQERRDAYRIAGKSVGFVEQCAELPEMKAERPDAARVHSQVLQNVLKRVARAFDDFFRRVKKGQKPGYPRFRSHLRYDSFTFPQAKSTFRLEGNRLHLSKIGKVKVHLSRPIEGKIKTCTIKREADGWYAIFAVEEPAAKPLPAPGESVGIDLGIENFATLSTGEVIENPQHLRAAERRLKTAHRKVSRRKRAGQRRKKAVRLLAMQHLKVKRQRADFHHKTARRLVNEFRVIVVEDLRIKGMIKNHHLAKSIGDAGWNQFIMILDSKAGETGRELIKVNPAFTSQDCSACGERVRKTLTMREHRCVACGLVMHRDHNAAANIERRGHRLQGWERMRSREN
ncbi:MAG: IS200/IS605 family transposase ISMma22 [Gammaproteobacteria bacterium]|nr:IS200/IS605 family transposase ISMma22 [Gammaproteobacteria bacterium]